MKIKPVDLLNLLSRVRSRNPVLEEVYSRVLGKPLLAESREAIQDFIDAVIYDRFDPEEFDIPGEAMLLEHGVVEAVQTSKGLVGVVDISGPLVARAAFCGPLSYDIIQADFLAALNAPEVSEIFMRFNTRGGEAAGTFELSDLIYKSRGVKPITAIIDPRAASAGYALASAADRIVLGRTNRIGSIGAFMVHMDRSERDKKKGLSFEFISFGDNKVAGNPHEPLSTEARNLFRSEIDELGKSFIDLVARNRGMSVADVEALGAIMYTGANAIEVGLADELGSLVELLEREEDTMTTTQQPSNFTGKFAAAVSALAALAATDDSPKELAGLQEQLTALAGEEDPETRTDLDSPPAAAVIDKTGMDNPVSASELVTLCDDAGHPAMAASLLKREMTHSQLKEFLERVTKVEQTAKTLDLNGAKISALIDDPAAMIRMAISEHAEKLDADIDGHIDHRSQSETASQSWDDAFAFARGEKRLRASA